MSEDEGKKSREDPWLSEDYSDVETKDQKERRRRLEKGFERRPKRSETPKIGAPPVEWYIRREDGGEAERYNLPPSVYATKGDSSTSNPNREKTTRDEGDDAAVVDDDNGDKYKAGPSEQRIRAPKNPSRRDSEDAESQFDGIRRAKVHRKAERGQNLNSKALRRSSRFNDDDWEWELPKSIPLRDPTPPPTPPPSVGGYPRVETPPPRDDFDPTDYEKEVAAAEYDNKLKEINHSEWEDKPLTKWVSNVVVKTTQRAMYKENTEQVKEGLKLVETITEPPLNKFFSLVTTLLPYVVFSISVLASFIDIVYTKAENPEFNITCLLLDLIEVAFLTINFFIHKSAWYKRKSVEDKEKFDRRQHILDNVLAELLLYPTIICSLVGVATDTPFFPEKFLNFDSWQAHMGRLDLLLITFDLISLMYVYGSRMFMVNSFMRKLQEMITPRDDDDDDDDDEDSDDHHSSCFSITRRIVYTIVLNSLLFGAMIALLGLQIYHENQDGNQPQWFIDWKEERGEDELVYMSHIAVYMLVSTIVIPILSIIVFVLANYYYILELMITLNVQVVKDASLRNELGKQGGKVADGLLGFAKKNVHATPGRLRDIQSLSLFQKVFYVLREWWIDLIFFVWATLIVLYCYFFYEQYSQDSVTGKFQVAYIASFAICVYLFIFGNYHSFAIVTVTNIIIIPLLISFGSQALIDKCRSLSANKEKKEASDHAKKVGAVQAWVSHAQAPPDEKVIPQPELSSQSPMPSKHSAPSKNRRSRVQSQVSPEPLVEEAGLSEQGKNGDITPKGPVLGSRLNSIDISIGGSVPGAIVDADDEGSGV